MRPVVTSILALAALVASPVGRAQDAPPPADQAQDTTSPPQDEAPLPDPTVPGPLLRGWSGPAPALPKVELRALLVPTRGNPVAVLEVEGVRVRVRAGTRLSVPTTGAPASAQGAQVLVLRVTEVGHDGVLIRVEPLGLDLIVS